MSDMIDEWAGSRRLSEAVTAMLHRLHISRRRFCELTGMPPSTLAAIEQTRRKDYRRTTLARLDEAAHQMGDDEWPGGRTLLYGRATGFSVDDIDARIRELVALRVGEARDELSDLVERLSGDDVALVTALARWLAYRPR
jgi:transcriptional regulator with XRE-family HTH domain